MSHLYYVITKRCNQYCNSCPRNNEERIQDTEKETICQNIAHTIKKHEVDKVIISGGEPSMHPEFAEIISCVAQLGIPILIQSNGIRFSDSKFAQNFLKHVNDRKQVQFLTAIHSIDPPIHDQVTGTPGSHERAVQAIHNLLEEGIAVTVKCIVGQHNYCQLPQYYQWVMDEFWGKAGICVSGMDYIGMSEEDISKYGIFYPDMKEYLERMLDLDIKCEGRPERVKVIELPFCITDPYYWKCYLNNKLDATLYQDAFMERPTRRIHDFGPCAKKCESCPVNHICPGIWRTQYLRYGEDSVPGIK